MTRVKKNYHHGELREALLVAALDLLEEEGLGGLSLRGIARRAGVSQAAPYTHFKNRNELLAATARVGYERLSQAMLKEEHDSADSSGRLLALGIAYVRFAAKNPALYALMFSSEITGSKHLQGLGDTASHSYGIMSKRMGDYTEEDSTGTGALAAWALAHGIADLILKDRIQLPRAAAEQRIFIREILSHLSP